ncbi:MAG: hypothetical protein O2960_17725 [Verrucomicrobia bacterium]|nr:hypothetical protein [Verrucomicrobiota bacterium]
MANDKRHQGKAGIEFSSGKTKPCRREVASNRAGKWSAEVPAFGLLLGAPRLEALLKDPKNIEPLF